MEHIKRMEVEYKELNKKAEDLYVFLNKETENPKFTNEKQRQLLKVQWNYMKDYLIVLSERIDYDKELLKK